jgi:thioredoxin 1
MTAVIHADQAKLEELLAAPNPVLIDFAADWCGPCKAMAPALEAFAQEREGALTVVKVNIDEAPELAMQYKVRGVPTLAVVSAGQLKAIKSGAMSKPQLAGFVDAALA